MKLIIGLGNPGAKYQKNRHNVGHLFVEWAMGNGQWAINNQIKFLKTNCFMNESGKFVKEWVDKYRGDWPHFAKASRGKGDEGDWGKNLYIIHDDLDIPLGQYKIQKGIGPKVHNGVNSVEQVLGRTDFWRIRIGVDAREKGEGERVKGEQYVLEDFSSEELRVLEGVFDAIAQDDSFPR